MQASEAKASGTLVIEAKSVAKSFGERPIVQSFSTRIARSDRVGIVGPNGAGKTTLIKLMTGTLEPDSGTVRLGAGLATVMLDQTRDTLDPETTLADTLTGGRGDMVGVGGEPRHVIGYLKDFLFSPEQARTPVKALSGGERGRLTLARALAKPSNLLVLDEPTNDLDLETLDVLEEMLGDYKGTVLLVSHDRDFLDRVATSVIAPEGGGNWVEYAGGYSDMLRQRGADLTREPGRGAKAANGKASGATAAAAAPIAKPGGAKRLSFHQQHALKSLPGRIKDLSGKIATLQTRVSDPNLFARDPALFAKTSAALAETALALEAAETEWLELEMLREETGA
jgi:ATP-binding cassette subfamily F protein uup